MYIFIVKYKSVLDRVNKKEADEEEEEAKNYIIMRINT
jgi:hypothetical protein